MAIPERLMGFINYENIEFPFEFNDDTFSLNLYPPSVEIWRGGPSIKELLSGLAKSERKPEWIGEIQLEGITADGKKVLFGLQDNRYNYYGFYSYQANWYFCYSEPMSSDFIQGFSISSDEINYYFNPQQVLKYDFMVSSDKTKLEKITIQSNKQITQSCGKYEIVPHIDAQIEVTCFAMAHSNTYINPIDATSKMITTFSSPVNIDTVISAYRYAMYFLQYVTYRTNIFVKLVPVFYLNQQGLRDYAGIIVFKTISKTESHKNRKEMIIPYSILQNRTSTIFANIKDQKLEFQHLCKSIEDTFCYSSSRIIMILATFEREYRNIYGTDNGRSQEYIDTKKEVVELIDNYMKSLHGKKRHYANQFRKLVQNTDNSFASNLKNALKDCKDIMTPFVISRYTDSYNKAIEGISERMGEVRNGIAHSRLDFHLDAVHLCDIKIIEQLLYAIRLKYIGINKEEIQESINRIFRENFAIPATRNDLEK